MLIAIDQEIVEKLIQTLEATQIELARARALSQVENDDPVGTQVAADYLGMTKAAVYQNQDKIPHRKRHGKLYFFKSELREYIETGTH